MAAYIRQRPPRWFWWTGLAATLWGALLVASFLFFTVEADPDFYAQFPSWFDIVFAGSVGSAMLGGIALMTRSQMAQALFLASLFLLLVQSAYMLLGSSVAGSAIALVPLFLIGVAAVEIWFAYYARRHGWIC